ncbi:MAG: hypothetical protein OXH48_04685, partial [Chloroflexi bacterium]|nr:hypothetical protein [Chloroflexota bacterium]
MAELAFVRDFTHNGYVQLRDYALGKIKGWSKFKVQQTEIKIDLLENYIAKFIGEPPRVVWRGNTGEWAEYLANKEVGDVVRIRPLTSTSLDVGVAMNFAKIGKEGEGRVLEIIPRKGGAYVGIRGVSSYDAEEKEWIMRP